MPTTLTIRIRIDESDRSAAGSLSGGTVEASPVDRPRDIQSTEPDANGLARLQLDVAGTYRISYTKNLDGAALLADEQVDIVDNDVEVQLVARLHSFDG